ncbi:MAG: ATP-binding cassette domain-containing protein [Acholeplasmatales bacterium]|jgi:ABC-2 type transport system ATP-binding protein|nr:ATP-binding cassette domain-containing protein [Acholeplasmatales bacterium]
MSYITIDRIVKDYGNNRGLFDVSFKVEKGQTIGIVGINGAGKTTLLRLLMGFIHQDQGSCMINGMDCWRNSEEIKKLIAYIPGEINFPALRYGDDFIKVQAQFWHEKDLTPTKDLTRRLQLDTTAILKRMSKGMKQKTAIATAFIPNNDILIFDEPTTGLDPLMRNVFLDVIKREKEKGRTIIMSSHMFEEVEDCCDKIILLKDGRILSEINIEDIRHNKEKKYKIEFNKAEDYENFKKEKITIRGEKPKYNQLSVVVHDEQINTLFSILSNYEIKYITEIKTTLEEYFLEEYKKGEQK